MTASGGAAGDWFGSAVAVSGDTAIIGAPGDDDCGDGSGSAYVFTRTGSTWTEQAKLTASDGAAGDRFGSSVAISGDTVVVGADSAIASGAAYVFGRSNATWSQQVRLTASDGAAGDHFGSSVAISGDTAVVGAWADGGVWGEPDHRSGSAYVFARAGSNWSQQAKLTASDGSAADFFGWSVAIMEDTALIGAPVDAELGSGPGSAYVYTRSGSVWAEQAKLTAFEGAVGDQFGWSVSISDNTALVGAQRDSVGDLGAYTGSAYVFARSGSMWSVGDKLSASDAAGYDHFGSSVATDADTAIIGAPWSEAGYVFVDNLGDAQAPQWPHGSTLTASSIGTDGLTLSWSEATDDVGVNGYRVYQDGIPIAATSGSASKWDVTELAPDTRYSFRVEAGDTVENWSSDGPSVTVTTVAGFGDIGGSIFVEDIIWLSANGITKGCNPPNNDRFCPSDHVTRGQMAAFLVRALGLTERLPDRFTDDDDSIFEGDIEKLAKAGITKGCNPPNNTRFCPDRKVTREQMAAFLVRALGYVDDGGGNLFIDDDGSIFENDIDKLGTAGVTRGCNPPVNDRFCPDAYVTRGAMAAFLHRALG